MDMDAAYREHAQAVYAYALSLCHDAHLAQDLTEDTFLRAMRTMADAHGRDGRASDAMLLFLVLNTTSVQLLPTTMIALRAQAGARNPADIVLPTLLATAAATGTGVTLCRLCAARGRGRR